MTHFLDPSDPPPRDRPRIVLITGMSGAGLSTALKAFEDLGYESVDNLRLSLIPTLVDEYVRTQSLALAVTVDTRSNNFSAQELLAVSDQLKAHSAFDVHLLFLDCADERLQRRFTETRRRHPLAIDRSVTDGIQKERLLLSGLKESADLAIDTSLLNIHDLRRLVAGHYRLMSVPLLSLFVTSFSYRLGIPREADIVLDVRFLANPFWEADLKFLTGLDQSVAEYIKKDPDYLSFIHNLSTFLLPLLPRYLQEGKSYLTIAIGCTGGRHRSVFVAEEVATILASHDHIVGVGHRDLDRSANKA